MIQGIYKNLLIDLVSEVLKNPNIDSRAFRAKHEDHLKEISKLEQSTFIEKRENTYNLSLLALVEVKKEVPEADSILFLCSRLFDFLRIKYKQSAGASISLEQLSKDFDYPEKPIRKALYFLIKAPIWSGHSSDILNASEVSLTPSEGFIEYKTFDALIKQLYLWAKKHDSKSKVLSEKHVPLFFQELEQNTEFVSLKIPEWYNKLNPKIQSLMQEIYYCIQKDLKALPSMGLRAVIDVICNDKIGDIGGYQKKIDVLEKKNFITQQKKEIIENILEIGHASTHRGFFPEKDDLITVLNIINNLLQDVYIFNEKSKRLREKAPKRKNKI